MCCFISQIDDTNAITKYPGIMEGLLDVVVDVLKVDESLGQEAFEAMIEMTLSHHEVWGNCVSKLIYVVS